jgi:hypothetical protein
MKCSACAENDVEKRFIRQRRTLLSTQIKAMTQGLGLRFRTALHRTIRALTAPDFTAGMGLVACS